MVVEYSLHILYKLSTFCILLFFVFFFLDFFFFFQAEDGIRYLVRSRGLGDVYKRQAVAVVDVDHADARGAGVEHGEQRCEPVEGCPVPLSLIHI